MTASTFQKNQKTATIFPKISRGELRDQSDKMRLFPNKSSVFKTFNQQKRIGSRSKKVKAVQNFPVPQNQTYVRSFSRLCSYYRQYNKNLAMIARPLHKAIEFKSYFTCTEETQKTIDSLRKHFLINTNSRHPGRKRTIHFV